MMQPTRVPEGKALKNKEAASSKGRGLGSLAYNSAFLVFGLFYLPFFFAKLRQAQEPNKLLRQRFGNLEDSVVSPLQGKKVIWLHAVSVGEVMACRKFLEILLAEWPQVHVLLTTVTGTGQGIAKQLESKRVSVAYVPFDLSFAVRKYLHRINPVCLLLMETEIWPNLLTEASRRRIPIGILNARLSPKSATRYHRFRPMFREVFEAIDFVLTQTAEDAERFLQIGIDSNKVQVLGNMKFDNVSLAEDAGDPLPLRQRYGLKKEDQVLLAGSTHPGEEELLVEEFLTLRTEFSHLKLIIAPRHIERSGAIRREIEERGLHVQYSTEREDSKQVEVLLINELGILKDLYAVADVVFVGGSLVNKGGQNPIEPAALKRPILHGPHISNFQKVYQQLDDQQGATQVQNASELRSALKSFLKSATEAATFGENAFRVIQSLTGASERHVNWILEHLKPELPEREDHVELHEKLFSPSGTRL